MNELIQQLSNLIEQIIFLDSHLKEPLLNSYEIEDLQQTVCILKKNSFILQNLIIDIQIGQLLKEDISSKFKDISQYTGEVAWQLEKLTALTRRFAFAIVFLPKRALYGTHK